MGLVRENIGFTRGQSEEEIKSTLFGFRVGQIIVQKDITPRRPMNSAFAIEYIVDSQLPDISLTIMGLGYFYYLKYKGPNDPAEKFFEFSTGLSTSTGDPKDFRALTSEEMDMVKEAIKKKPEQYEDKKRWFDVRTGEVGKKILLKEDFQRGMSGREIKDQLVGFRPGQLFTYDKEWAKNKPYREVYMFVKRAKEGELEGDGIPIIACYIGALSQRDGKLSQFLARNKRILGTTNLWQEEKRGLTDEEVEKVKKTFSELPGYLKKITEETGLVPSLQ
jgi:hypothetical protein